MFRNQLLVGLVAVSAVIGCAPESAEKAAMPTAETKPALAMSAPVENATSELAGTVWRLVNIAGMDDSTRYPDDPSKYTLEFAADGAASVRLDCNRGTGTWTSESAGQLAFGPIAATRTLCPPGSLSDKYTAQFEWVRSYVLKDGHLFLATMADGSIIEFEPLPPVVAQVFGEDIRAAQAAEMQDAVLSRVFNHYAAENAIVVEKSEVAAYVETLKRGMAAEGLTAEDDLTPDERKEVDTMRRQMAQSVIRQWKINQSLFQAYGGRIIYQQLGPEPLDANRQHLEGLQAAGDLAIVDPAMAAAFWRYFTNDSMHDFMKAGSKDETRAFAIPPWQTEG
jgi:heat shock protein HslJ